MGNCLSPRFTGSSPGLTPYPIGLTAVKRCVLYKDVDTICLSDQTCFVEPFVSSDDDDDDDGEKQSCLSTSAPPPPHPLSSNSDAHSTRPSYCRFLKHEFEIQCNPSPSFDVKEIEKNQNSILYFLCLKPGSHSLCLVK